MSTGNTLRGFAAKCPRGHRPAQTASAKELRRPDFEFYCVLCDLWWVPSLAERALALSTVNAAAVRTISRQSPDIAVVPFTCENCGIQAHVHCYHLDDATGCSDEVIECLDCGRANHPVLPGPVLDVSRA
jgi:hypothetical protein